MGFSKINPDLGKGRYFTTVWCTLDSKVFPFLHQVLEPIVPYCNWLSTYGDSVKDSKYLPHISLRYLGFTEELDKERLVRDAKLFSAAINKIKVKEIEVGEINIWERRIGNQLLTARLNWRITDKQPLINLHNQLLTIPNYQFFENLEGNNYSPHISLGEVNIDRDNYERVKQCLNGQTFSPMMVALTSFAINYTGPNFREEILL